MEKWKKAKLSEKTIMYLRRSQTSKIMQKRPRNPGFGRHSGTLLAEPFFCLLDFGVLEKDFIEYALRVARIQSLIQA